MVRIGAIEYRFAANRQTMNLHEQIRLKCCMPAWSSYSMSLIGVSASDANSELPANVRSRK